MWEREAAACFAQVFVSKVGMARFCTDEYRPPTRRNQDNAFMHLTNYSINKENTSCFIRSPDIHNTSNSKRLLKDVLEDLRAEGTDAAPLKKHDVNSLSHGSG